MQQINLAEKLARFGGRWEPEIVGGLDGRQVKLVKFRGPFG